MKLEIARPAAKMRGLALLAATCGLALQAHAQAVMPAPQGVLSLNASASVANTPTSR